MLLSLAKKWSAGAEINDVLAAAKNCNSKGHEAILNCLGEDYTEEEKINLSVREYCTLLQRLNAEKIEGSISVKLSQVGLSLGYDLCLKKMKTMVAMAKELGIFIWIDMESSKYTDSILAVYLILINYYKNIGVVLQSTLRRSASDLLHLLELEGKVRLVKGAYRENEKLAFRSNSQVNANYKKLLRILFGQVSPCNDLKNSTHDNNSNNSLMFAIATHDSKLIEYGIELWKTSRIARKNFQFQFLRGIRDELKKHLTEEGFRTAEYIPYGREYLHYSLRRLRERKRNIFLLARSLLQP